MRTAVAWISLPPLGVLAITPSTSTAQCVVSVAISCA